MCNKHVKFGPKIFQLFGKIVRKTQGGNFLTHTVDRTDFVALYNLTFGIMQFPLSPTKINAEKEKLKIKKTISARSDVREVR